LLIEGCRKLKIDGVLDRYHSGCRTVVGDALLISGAFEKELGIPVLVLEWENFDPGISTTSNTGNNWKLLKR